ncbi:molybdate ABC transporter substrate-binding protein [Rosistilla oblonga]|uniref:molybdate ABC transporter substrate-binding protein n=1 Tax=Rosistilla oblonga TaxID=2527990 RepID=UPI003A97B81C
MSKIITAMLISIALVAGLVGWLIVGDGVSPRTISSAAKTPGGGASDSPKSEEDLRIYCAASNLAVMERIRQDYEQSTGTTISVQYGPSQSLLAQLQLTQTGDLYLPADDSYLVLAEDAGLLSLRLPIATMQVGLAVKRGNPKRIADFPALLTNEIRVGQANPDAAAVGMLTRACLLPSGKWSRLADATTAFRGTVAEVANDVHVGAADVGIVYDAVLHSYPDLEFVAIEALRPAKAQVAIGILKSSRAPDQALDFARYLTAPDRGLKVYAEHGFYVAEQVLK